MPDTRRTPRRARIIGNMLTSDTVRPIAALITTYDRVDDARANMEVIRSNWSRPGGFPDVVIVHAYNGSPDWYPRPEHDDMLITVPPARSHFTGAAELIDRGLAAASWEISESIHGLQARTPRLAPGCRVVDGFFVLDLP